MKDEFCRCGRRCTYKSWGDKYGNDEPLVCRGCLRESAKCTCTPLDAPIVEPDKAAGFQDYIQAFHNRYVGQTVRGQKVESVEFTVDTLAWPSLRCFLVLVFQENPPSNESKEKNLLERVFSEIPHSASVQTNSLQMAMDWMVGSNTILDKEWRLDDELPSKMPHQPGG